MSSESPMRLPALAGYAQSVGSMALSTMTGSLLLTAVIIVNEGNLRGTSAPDTQTILKFLICAACGLYGSLSLPRTQSLLIGSAGAWATLLSGWALLCTLASVDVVYSLFAVGTLWCLLLFAPAVLIELGPRRLVVTAVVALSVLLVGCWGVHIVAPEINGFQEFESSVADPSRLGGLVHPNGTGRLAALAVGLIVVAACERYLSWKQLCLPLAVALVSLVWTGSRTWMLAAMGVALLAVWQQFGAKGRALLLCAGVTTASIAALFLVNSLDFGDLEDVLISMSRGGEVEEMYSMTGRTDLWALSINKIGDFPVFGCGYGAQRFVLADEIFWTTRHAHNLLLNTTLGVGIAGGLILATALVWQAINLFIAPSPFPDVLLVLVVIGGLADNPILNPMPGVMTVLFFVSLVWRSAQQNARVPGSGA